MESYSDRNMTRFSLGDSVRHNGQPYFVHAISCTKLILKHAKHGNYVGWVEDVDVKEK